MGLELPVTPPPPLTSFPGCRSRTLMCPFFIRRQTDRITLILGSLFCASTTNYFVAAFALGWPTNPIIANIFTALPLFVLVHLDDVASIGNSGYLHLNFRLWACLLFALRQWHRRVVDARPRRPSSESGHSDESILLSCAFALGFLTLPRGHPFCSVVHSFGLFVLVHLVLATACAAFAAGVRLGFIRDTGTTFDVFSRLQVTKFDVPFLQSAPNRLDYIDVAGL
jgi:hypothetical protein